MKVLSICVLVAIVCTFADAASTCKMTSSSYSANDGTVLTEVAHLITFTAECPPNGLFYRDWLLFNTLVLICIICFSPSRICQFEWPNIGRRSWWCYQEISGIMDTRTCKIKFRLVWDYRFWWRRLPTTPKGSTCWWTGTETIALIVILSFISIPWPICSKRVCCLAWIIGVILCCYFIPFQNYIETNLNFIQ